MAVNHIKIESMDILIKAVQDYQEELLINRQILENAANVCDAALGSDDISKKYIARLEESLNELSRTSLMAADIEKALLEEKRRAIEVYED